MVKKLEIDGVIFLILRDTPTSTGPNSYGKTNMGFTDSRKLFEKKLQEKADELLKQEEEKKLKASLNK